MSEIVRKLASIRRIANIEPIPGADKIVKATIDGWELVTQKDNYVPGDLALYFEIDSFLPVREEFEFLRKSSFKSTVNLGDGFRIKTIKLRGQVSQGLSLPLKDFFQKDDHGWFYVLTDENGTSGNMYLEEGTDLTEYFKVQKYEKPEPKAGGFNTGHSRGNFPDFIPKTDQERIQNCFGGIKKWIKYAKPEIIEVQNPEQIEKLEAYNNSNIAMEGVGFFFKKEDKWFGSFPVENTQDVIDARSNFEATIKLDGSSMTVYYRDGQLGVCSRNFDLKRTGDSVFWKTALDTGILADLLYCGKNIAVQGELMGPGVQGNREKFDSHHFFVYDIYDIDQKRYLTPSERSTLILDQFWSVEQVPSLGDVEIENMTVQDFLKAADETKSIVNEVAEGIVYKSCVEGGPSFKVIANRFLLAEKD